MQVPGGQAFHLKGELVVAKIHKAVLIPYLFSLEVEAAVEGTVLITQAQLYFRVAETDGVLVSMAHGMMERIRKVQGKERANQPYVVDIVCKDLRTIRLGLPGKLQYKQLVSVIEAMAYELEISNLFALKWGAASGNDFGPPWRYDAVAEYERCGLHTGDHRLTSFNKNYAACDSYPQVLAVPSAAKDDLLAAVAEFRSRGRIPVATYLYGPTGAALYRCSQPLVGLKNTRCADDEILLAMMAAAPSRSAGVRLHIMDARPKVAAVGNKFLGAGMEHVGPGSRYEQCSLEYLNIGNIHTMRGALQKLMEALDVADVRKQEQGIDRSDWKEYSSRILTGAMRISTVLANEGHPVLVHCTDGWDRTAQLTCLTELMLDPFYRTINGFAILVEKEWLSFGHKFAQRHGHGTFSPKYKDTQRAPIFLQFVDCCWQLLQQFPTSFEWNERMLLMVVDACYSCLFGTFLCNTDQERRVLYKVTDNSVSLWTYLLHNRKVYANPLFEAGSTLRLVPKLGVAHMQLWRALYCRFQWMSVNELVGMQVGGGGGGAASSDLTVLTFNCAKLDRTSSSSLVSDHAARKHVVVPSLLVGGDRSDPPPMPPASPQPPRPMSPSAPLVRVAATRVARSGSVTMEEIEGARRRRLSLEREDNESLSMGNGLHDDVEEDQEEDDNDEENDEDDNGEEDVDILAKREGGGGGAGRVSRALESFADPEGYSGASEDFTWATSTTTQPTTSSPKKSESTMSSPRNRQDASKRRGVKLDANEILVKMTETEHKDE